MLTASLGRAGSLGAGPRPVLDTLERVGELLDVAVEVVPERDDGRDASQAEHRNERAQDDQGGPGAVPALADMTTPSPDVAGTWGGLGPDREQLVV